MANISNYGRGVAMGMMKRFSAYLSRLCEVLGHADRKGPMRENFTRLMLPLKIIVNNQDSGVPNIG
jgi:hypothetical protein